MKNLTGEVLLSTFCKSTRRKGQLMLLVRNFQIETPVVLIQIARTLQAVQFYAARQVIVVEGERTRLHQSFPRGGIFHFSSGYVSVYCEILPTTASAMLARNGELPTLGKLNPDQIIVRELETGVHVGMYTEKYSSEIGHTMGRTVVANRYKAMAPMAAALQRLGVPKCNIADVLHEVRSSFWAARL